MFYFFSSGVHYNTKYKMLLSVSTVGYIRRLSTMVIVSYTPLHSFYIAGFLLHRLKRKRIKLLCYSCLIIKTACESYRRLNNYKLMLDYVT